MIKVINAHFIQSCERFSQAPSILGAEIAILGRSNVGKSSLINALLNNKNLAKSSSTPGKTRLVNFFNAKWWVDSAESQNLGGNQTKNAESSADSADFTTNAESTNKAQQTIEGIAVEVVGFLDDFRGNFVLGDKARPKSAQDAKSSKSPQDAPKSKLSEFEVRILDFPGFGYAKVSKVEKSSWDKHLSEFLKKRDSIKLYLHLIDSRHQNLEIDNEIFAFLNRFKRGDSAILQVFTKADKLSKNELSRLKNQNKFYHSINDKNSTEILRCAILKMLYNVDF